MENTYKQKPDQSFPVCKIKRIVEELLRTHLQEVVYDATSCSSLSRQLADVIKSRVKHLQINRYKLVCSVLIGQKEAENDMFVASQCVWDDRFDTYVRQVFENSTLYAVVIVYGIYVE